MRSPALAIAWEFRQRHRVALVALAAYALVLVAVRLLIPGPGRPFTLDPPSGNAVAVIVPLGTTFMYLLAAFSFGLAGDVAGRLSIFPARMFTLPVTTRALAGWPMLLGAAAMASLWLVTASFVGWSWGLDLPLVWPALLGAVFLAWTQVLMWTAYGLPGLRVLLAVLWLAALAVVVILAVHLEVPEPRMVAMLAPQLPLAYLAACLAVARARRGDVPDWRGVLPRIGRLPRVLSPRRERFASPVRAQVWFEWRQRGLVLPALVGIVLPFELGLLHLASDEPAVLVGLTLLAVLLTPPFMAGFTAATAGPAGRDGDPAGVTLEATRPMTTATLVGARLRTALWSALAAWLLVVVAVPVALALTGGWPVVADGVGGFVEVVGRPRAIVLALLGLAGLLASTWKQLVQSLCIGLTGRAWVVRASVLVRLSLLVIAWPILDWVTDNGKLALARLWDGWPWILATLAGLKLAAAAWVVSRLHRSRLLRGRSLVAGAALWSAVVLALYGVLVWLVSTPEFVPRPFLALVAILAVPLVRLSAAPLALAWSRHRGARRRPDRESRASREGTWALRTTWALLALPLALVGAEAASHAVRNRNSGTLVSSGREREYLLHVPRRYDPAKPTPLVISMHGAGGWPAMQRDVSRWDALADSQGFIVVYPSGLRGRGPTIWRADRGSGLREDVRFISDLIDALKATYNVDPSRIYADGLSNGGGMAFVLSCTLSDRIAAVGLVASAQLLPFDWCTDPRPVPMIAFHGTADRLTPYEGGESWVVPRPLPDIPTFAADWARRNRCGSAPVESRVAADVRRLEYANCADDADVVLYAVGGGGHTWPGGGPLPEWLAGPTSRSVDATSEIWAFFRDHPLPTR